MILSGWGSVYNRTAKQCVNNLVRMQMHTKLPTCLQHTCQHFSACTIIRSILSWINTFPLRTSWIAVVRVHRGSTIVATRLRERPDVLSDDIAAHIRLTTTDCGAHNTITSGRYFRLNTPPTDSRSHWNSMNSLLRPVASTSVTHTADDFSTFFTERLTPFLLRRQPLQHQRLSTDRLLHSLASIMWP